MRGTARKLCRGGGQEVAHSREPPKPQGSSGRPGAGPRVWKPTNSVQKCTFPQPSLSSLPVIFGHQK
jgi:hypothetical protein